MPFLILSVGHNPLVLRERHSTLTAAGYSVTSVYSKEEAMDKLLEGDFDLVLMCPSLGTDRPRLVKAVRRHRPSIPVVSTTPDENPPMPDCWAYVTGSSAHEIVAAVYEILANEQEKFAARRGPKTRYHETGFGTKASA
jgi:CheY-like chemotaxis protein